MVGVAVTAGTGFTVIVTVIGAPGHPPEVGVMVYTAVPGTVPVVLNVCAIVDPGAAVAPVTPVCTTVQLYVVAPSVLLSAMDVAEPEQMVCDEGVAVATGAGLITIGKVADAAAQPPLAAIVFVMV